jgi:hypothetical protein
MFKYKNQEELENLSAEELKQYHTDMKAHEAKLVKDQIDKAVEEATDKSDAKIKELSEDIQSLEEKLKVTASPELKAFLHTVVKENFESIKENMRAKKDFKFEITKVATKAPTIHTTTNTVSNVAGLSYPLSNNYEVEPNIARIRVPENFILEMLPNRQKSVVPQILIKRQQLPTEGAAAKTAEGGLKPLLKYAVQNTSTKREKYAGRIEYTEEFEMDFEDLLADIIDMFETDVLTAWQDGLFNIVDTNATSYVGGVLDGTFPNPDNGLAIVAAGLQVESLGYYVTKVVMNPQDIAASFYTQDLNGNFSIKPYIDANGNVIGSGYQLIKSHKVPVGVAYVGDFDVYREIHSGFIIRRGQYGEQFIHNEYTIVGEVFSILNAAPIDYKGIVKVNLATVKAALKKA